MSSVGTVQVWAESRRQAALGGVRAVKRCITASWCRIPTSLTGYHAQPVALAAEHTALARGRHVASSKRLAGELEGAGLYVAVCFVD